MSSGFSTRRPANEEPSREFGDHTFGRFNDYFNENYDQSRDKQGEQSEGWRGWRGIPTPSYANSNRNNMYNDVSIATTLPPQRFHNDFNYPAPDPYTSDQYVNEVPTPHSRHGWRPRNNDHNHVKHVKRIIVRKPLPERHQESSYEEQQEEQQHQPPPPSPFEHKPAYEPSKFWHPDVPGFDSMTQDTSANKEEREEEEIIEDHHSPTHPHYPSQRHHGHQKVNQDSGRSGRGSGGSIKSSESRAQGVIVTGKDLQADAGQCSIIWSLFTHSFIFLVFCSLSRLFLTLLCLPSKEMNDSFLFITQFQLQCSSLLRHNNNTHHYSPLFTLCLLLSEN